MKKILCMTGPFNPEQIAYVYENGNKLDAIKFNINNMNTVLEKLISDYDINDIEFKGPLQYNKGIWENFELYTNSKYGVNNFREIKVRYV